MNFVAVGISAVIDILTVDCLEIQRMVIVLPGIVTILTFLIYTLS